MDGCFVALALWCSVATACGKSDKGDDNAGTGAASSVEDAAVAAANPSSTFDAAIPTAKPVEPEDRGDEPRTVDPVAYRKQLAAGRALEANKDYAGAVAAFEQALVARPDDPRALSELSWAAFQKGDYALAIDAALASVSRGKGDVKAGALYNLGRALEKTNDRNGTIMAYRGSLALRPSAVVAARLEKLTGAKLGDALVTDAMQGPVATFAELCSQFSVPGDCQTFESQIVHSHEAPIASAYMFNRIGAGCQLTVRTDGGWYLLLVSSSECIGNRYWSTEIHGIEFPSGELAQFHYTDVGTDYTDNTRQEMEVVSREEYFTLCGVGPSGVPSCATIPGSRVDGYADRDVSATVRIAGDSVKVTRGGKTYAYTLTFK